MNDTNNYTMRQRMLDASISAYAITYSDGIHFDPDLTIGIPSALDEKMPLLSPMEKATLMQALW